MEPYFFDASGRRLYGAYHPPGGAAHDAGVVICPPWGQEAVRAHRALFHLAGALAGRGLHVLRFDPSGCGDSEDPGPALPEGGELALWRDDVCAALRELREGSGAGRAALVGLRLGASLAAQVSAQATGVDAVALWDPVVVGAEHSAELRARHEAWRRGSFAKATPEAGAGSAGEVLGFALSPTLAAGLDALDLRALEACQARRALVLDTGGSTHASALADHLGALGAEAELRRIAAPAVWTKLEDDLGDAVVPVEALAQLVDWLAEALS